MLNQYEKIKAFQRYSLDHFEIEWLKFELHWIEYDIQQNIKWNKTFGPKSKSKTLHLLKKWCARLIFDPFSAPRTTRMGVILLNFVEAVLNLFMKLQTSTLIKLDNLDIKLEVIEFQSRILCQFNSISSEK